MRNLAQGELNLVAAGITSHKENSQPKAGAKEDVAWLVFSATVQWFVNAVFDGWRDKNKNTDKNEKEDKDSRYGHFGSKAPF